MANFDVSLLYALGSYLLGTVCRVPRYRYITLRIRRNRVIFGVTWTIFCVGVRGGCSSRGPRLCPPVPWPGPHAGQQAGLPPIPSHPWGGLNFCQKSISRYLNLNWPIWCWVDAALSKILATGVRYGTSGRYVTVPTPSTANTKYRNMAMKPYRSLGTWIRKLFWKIFFLL